MVRDLEQMKENEEGQLISRKEKLTNSNNHHCKMNFGKDHCKCVFFFSKKRTTIKSRTKTIRTYYQTPDRLNRLLSNLKGCTEHSEMLDNHSNHSKMCHRGDGQCTCYYCTIFGHAVSHKRIG